METSPRDDTSYQENDVLDSTMDSDQTPLTTSAHGLCIAADTDGMVPGKENVALEVRSPIRLLVMSSTRRTRIVELDRERAVNEQVSAAWPAITEQSNPPKSVDVRSMLNLTTGDGAGNIFDETANSIDMDDSTQTGAVYRSTHISMDEDFAAYKDNSPHRDDESSAVGSEPALHVELEGLPVPGQSPSEKPRKCRDCGKVFATPTDYKTHRAAEHRFYCSLCSHSTPYKDQTRYHEERCSQRDGMTRLSNVDRKCLFCAEYCEPGFAVLEHVKVHLVNDLYPCSAENCSTQFENYRDISFHLKDAHGPPQTCGICGYSSRYRSTFGKHGRLHKLDAEKLVKFDCLFCPLQFGSPRFCWNHMQHQHAVDKLLTCPRCQHVVSLPSDVEYHRKSLEVCTAKAPKLPRTFKCRYCSFVSRVKADAQTHREQHLTDGFYVCPKMCGKRYATYRELNNHYAERHISGQKCALCPRILATRRTRRMHMKHHKKNDEREKAMLERSEDFQYHCNLCGYASRHQAGLASHKRGFHSDVVAVKSKCKKQLLEKPVDVNSCYYCATVLEPPFNHHYEQHLVDGRYPCRQCSKSFPTREKVLRHHMLCHIATLYTCELCGFQTKSDSSFAAHKYVHYPNEPCEICGHVFESYVALRSHKTKCKGKSATALTTLTKKSRRTLPHKFPRRNRGRPGWNKSKIFHCRECAETPGSKVELEYHMQTVHPDTPVYSVPELNLPTRRVPVNSCRVCQYNSLDEPSAKAHFLRKHQSTSAANAESSESIAEVEWNLDLHSRPVVVTLHWCEICSHTWKSAAALLIHTKVMHPAYHDVIAPPRMDAS